MEKTKLYSLLLSIGFILTGLFSVAATVQFNTGLPVANTTIWWFFQFCFLSFIAISIKFFVSNNQFLLMKLVTFYIIFILINAIRGFIIAEGYWDFKGLITNVLALLIPLAVYLGTNEKLLSNILSVYFKYGLAIFIMLLFVLPKVAYGYYLVPVTLVALFLSALSTRHKVMILSLTILVLVIDLTARSNVIKFLVPVMLGSLYYFRVYFTIKVLNFTRVVLLVMPVFLLVTAVTDTFNIFKMEDYISMSFSTNDVDKFGDSNEENLLADTRTFLYIETFYTADYYNSWLFGRSPTRGTLSDSFGDDDQNGRGERLGSEVAIINIFTWLGLIGVIFYGAIFYQASYLAITQSNNYYCKILGIFIAFRWCYAWIEDFTDFNLNYLLLWIMIGMCYSTSFRGMSDSEFTSWIIGIFPRFLRMKIK
jgi:hypothetical protein